MELPSSEPNLSKPSQVCLAPPLPAIPDQADNQSQHLFHPHSNKAEGSSSSTCSPTLLFVAIRVAVRWCLVTVKFRDAQCPFTRLREQNTVSEVTGMTSTPPSQLQEVQCREDVGPRAQVFSQGASIFSVDCGTELNQGT